MGDKGIRNVRWNEDVSGDLKGWVEIFPWGGMSLTVSGDLPWRWVGFKGAARGEVYKSIT